MTKRLLKDLGIDKKTEKVYRALLSLADAPAGLIAQKAGIKRTSAYHVLESLIQMGLVSSYTQRGVVRFYAENPKKLKTYFESKAIIAERIFENLIKDINTPPSSYGIRLFEGKKGIQSLHEEALSTKEKKILSIGSSEKLLSSLGHMAYGERRRKLGIISYALRYDMDRKHHRIGIDRNIKLSDIRYLPDDFKFPGMMLIFDTRVAIITYERNGFGFIITSKDFAEMCRSFFEILWNGSRKN